MWCDAQYCVVWSNCVEACYEDGKIQKCRTYYRGKGSLLQIASVYKRTATVTLHVITKAIPIEMQVREMVFRNEMSAEERYQLEGMTEGVGCKGDQESLKEEAN